MLGLKAKVVKLRRWIKNETVWYQVPRKQTKHLVVKDSQESVPWHPSWGNQGTDYMEDERTFPWHPSRGNLGTDYMEERQAFPWHPSRDMSSCCHFGYALNFSLACTCSRQSCRVPLPIRQIPNLIPRLPHPWLSSQPLPLFILQMMEAGGVRTCEWGWQVPWKLDAQKEV